ncbi:cysteine proteinase inhibitor 5-like [Primulina huaijiensis]|uniref:cysteine proteinase inhibitor 5-like n=1 Tax=Primulina huaijiensis TaxID=1492673 RepID=UPI003CC749A8
MAPKFLSLLVVAFSILLASFSIEASIAGWNPISNLTDPKVVEIGKFAVKEHNKRVNALLSFVSIVKGETQIVNGMNYRLIISATDAHAANAESNYRVVVWDNPWRKERRLISFEKIA